MKCVCKTQKMTIKILLTGHINLPPVRPFVCSSVRPSGYRYMVCPAISSYSFGATALIFCMMFIHIMVVCMSTGFLWASFVSYRHTSFLKNHSYQNNFVHNYQVQGHTSFLVFNLFLHCTTPRLKCGVQYENLYVFSNNKHIIELC
jgi:hypothetical protein